MQQMKGMVMDLEAETPEGFLQRAKAEQFRDEDFEFVHKYVTSYAQLIAALKDWKGDQVTLDDIRERFLPPKK